VFDFPLVEPTGDFAPRLEDRHESHDCLWGELSNVNLLQKIARFLETSLDTGTRKPLERGILPEAFNVPEFVESPFFVSFSGSWLAGWIGPESSGDGSDKLIVS
jgi:hypothetical protein